MTVDIAAQDEVVQFTPMPKRKAQGLNKQILNACKQINTSREELATLLDQAAAGQIHLALGFASWTAWFTETVHIVPVDMADRKALTQMMALAGASTRAIAGVLGSSQSTAVHDLADAEGLPEQVTSLDGAQRPRQPAKADAIEADTIDAEVVDAEEVPVPTNEPDEPEEPAERTAADVIEDFGGEIDTLQINVQAFKDILGDELFTKARKRIAQRFCKRLDNAITDLQKILNDVMAQ